MKIQISLVFAPVKINKKLFTAAGYYLLYLKDPDKINENLSKQNLFLFKIFGLGSLGYLKVITLYYRLVNTITGGHWVPKT